MNIQKNCLQCGSLFSKAVNHSKKVWSLKKYCSRNCASIAWIGHTPPKSAFKKGQNVGSKNNKWKKNPCYSSIHQWVARNKVKPLFCENCGRQGNSREIEWSNNDHLYKRNLDDYKALCRPCHNAHHKEKGITNQKQY